MDSSSRLKTSDAATVRLEGPPVLRYPGERQPLDSWVGDEREHSQLQGELGERLLVATVILVFFVVLLRSAWLSEDSYVTFRTLDNFARGHGLRWNAVDRVQAYSHPLWLLSLVPFYAVFGDPYPAAVLLSVVLSLGVTFLCVRLLAANRAAAILAIASLMSSRAFMDYSTSGLENPMTHFLLALLFIAYLQCCAEKHGPSARQLFFSSSILGLLAVNRLDTVLLGLPMLFVCWHKSEASKRHLAALGGLIPLLIWEAFSLVYYGSLIPNTAYAKLSTGIGKVELLKQGGIYFVDLLSQDPLSFLLLLLGLCAPLALRQRRLYAPLLGLLAYIGYIVYIGGDFMSGRFFSSPVALSCFILAQVPFASFQHGLLAAAAALGISLFGLNSPLTSSGDVALKPFGVSGVADERSFYYVSTGLLRLARPVPFPENSFLSEGRRDRELAKKADEKLLRRRINVGFYGFAAGPEVHIVDPLALGDALLARLPAVYEPGWRVGHYDRVVPQGYEESIQSGRAELTDPRLNRYYQKLRLLTQGQIWSAARWRTLWGFLTGQYDSLIDRQRYRFADATVDRAPLKWNKLDFQHPVAESEDLAPALRFGGTSALIQSGKLERPKAFKWHYSSPKPSKLYFLNGTTIVGDVKLPATKANLRHEKTILVPPNVQERGFNGVYFRAERGPFQHEIYGIEVDP